MKIFDKIYSIVARIPRGKVMTYGQVAKIADVNPRVVGFAMHSNKNTTHVPCHRVVDSQGKLRGYAFGGLTIKKQILENEGILFLDGETIDLQKYQYLQ